MIPNILPRNAQRHQHHDIEVEPIVNIDLQHAAPPAPAPLGEDSHHPFLIIDQLGMYPGDPRPRLSVPSRIGKFASCSLPRERLSCAGEFPLVTLRVIPC